MRRVWIEIDAVVFVQYQAGSPSMRRVWIEIVKTISNSFFQQRHPPCGGCGLKYQGKIDWKKVKAVTLHAEGVD